MIVSFQSGDEFKELLNRTFTLISEDPEIGPKLRDADTPQRFEFSDFEFIFNIRAGKPDDGEPNLVWVWDDDISWEPKVRMSMASDTANRYFQGRENVALAIARRRIRAAGDVKAALAMLPLLKPVFASYRKLVTSDYPHLEV